MKKLKTETSDWAASNSQNITRLRYWIVAWIAASALVAFGPGFLWNYNTSLTIAGVLLTLGIGFGMIFANKTYLHGMDELHQKIFLDAGALTLGVGLVCGLSYEMLEDIKLIPFEPEISHLVMLMCLTFLAGLINGQRKYQ